MGMYTALSLGVELKEGVPQEVVDTLRFMIEGPTDEQMPPGMYHVSAAQQFAPADFSHSFFDCDRWTMLFRCDSYYFDWQTGWRLDRDDLYGPERPKYYLTGVSNLKNYDGEIRKFLDWLSPYIDTTGFLGWTMYEEDLVPTIIYRAVKQLHDEEIAELHYVNVQDKLAQLNLVRDYL